MDSTLPAVAGIYPPLKRRKSQAPFMHQSSAWCLLDQEAYMDDRLNATTAVARTRSGQSVKVSFVAAEPPRPSHFCVHCPGLSEEWDFMGRPCVLCSVENLALIRIIFACGPKTEYFLYTAGGGLGLPPLLEHLGHVGDYLSRVPFVASVGILPGNSNSSHFVLAALGFTLAAGQYELHVFRSERRTWTNNMLVHGNRRRRVSNIEKVIALGGGELGFVDLWKGILVCDVLKEKPTSRFIPLPKLLPNNMSDNHFSSARSFRDLVVCMDGLIRCIELEDCLDRRIKNVKLKEDRRTNNDQVPEDVSNMDVLLDSDMLNPVEDAEQVTEEETYEYTGWRIITWSRTVLCTCWRKESLIHVDDILVNNPIPSALLGELKSSMVPTLTLNQLFKTVPSLSLDDKDALYLISKAKTADQRLCVIEVDMGKKTLGEISPIFNERPNFCTPTYISCALSKYLNIHSCN